MYSVGKGVIIDLIIKLYCDLQNFDYDKLSNDGYSIMYDDCFKLDDDLLIAKLGELYEILQK